MRKLLSEYFLAVLILLVTIFCFGAFEELFMRSSSPVAVMVADFAGGLL